MGWLALALVSVSGAEGRADVLSEIAERGEIRFGYRSDAPPFSYEGENGPAGLAVALCREVAYSLQVHLNLPVLRTDFIPVTAQSRFDALEDKLTDVHCGPASATLARREKFDFSILYFVDGAVAVVRPGTFESIFDVSRSTIGVNEGTTTKRMVRDLMNRNGMDGKLQGYLGHEAGLTALADREIDIYFGDSAIMQFQIRKLDLADRVKILPDEYSFEPYALVMKRGETALRLAVDRALSEIYDSGLIYNLIRDELGNFRLTPLNRAVFQIVGLPG